MVPIDNWQFFCKISCSTKAQVSNKGKRVVHMALESVNIFRTIKQTRAKAWLRDVNHLPIHFDSSSTRNQWSCYRNECDSLFLFFKSTSWGVIWLYFFSSLAFSSSFLSSGFFSPASFASVSFWSSPVVIPSPFKFSILLFIRLWSAMTARIKLER